MNNTNILKVFIKFLKGNDAYNAFLYNLKMQNYYRCDDYKYPDYYVKKYDMPQTTTDY